MSVQVIDHYPSINQDEIPRNVTIWVKFNKTIVPQSVTYNHLSVNHNSSFTTVPGEWLTVYNIYGVPDRITFTPTTNLVANDKYKVFIYGAPNSVISTNNEQLDTTYSFLFTTGAYTVENGSGLLDSGVIPVTTDIPEGEVLDVPSGYQTTYSVYSTEPQNQEPNHSLTLSSINIQMTGLPCVNTSDFITINESEVLY